MFPDDLECEGLPRVISPNPFEVTTICYCPHKGVAVYATSVFWWNLKQMSFPAPGQGNSIIQIRRRDNIFELVFS